MKLQLKKFDMSSIKDDKVVVMIGKRDTGKSFLCQDLLYYHRDIPVGTVISGTERANKTYGDIVPPVFIHDEFKEQIVQNILSRQERVIAKYNEEKSQIKSNKSFSVNEQPKTDPRTFLLLDDCLYDQSWCRSKNIRALFMNGRHWKVFFIITMQYPLGIPPILRSNIDYVFICRENIVQNRRRIYESFAGMFNSFDLFCTVLDQTTENYECLVIHNNSKSNNLLDQVFWYKADAHESFRMCSDQIWKFNNERIKEKNQLDGERDWDPSEFKKKNQTVINVKKYDSFF